VEEWLEKTIQSFLSQTLQDSELILVNDCSPDNSKDIIAKYTGNERIRVFNNPYNLGAGASRQIGLSQAQGEFTMFVDGDDWLEADCFEKMYEAAIEGNADIVSCKVIHHDDYGLRHSLYKGRMMPMFGLYNFINNKIIKSEIWDKVEYSPLRYMENMNSLFRCLEFSKKTIEVDYHGYHYNRRLNSLLTSGKGLKTTVYEALSILENLEYEALHLPFPSSRWKSYYNIRHLQMLYGVIIKNKEIEQYKEEIEIIKNYLWKRKAL
jgi:glycosyltransferase involved in cell wall biosynthesis